MSGQDTFISLLSGGLDSVVNFVMAQRSGKVLCALTIDYGQRAASKEIQSAKYFCEKLKVKHEVISLPWLGGLTKTALVNREEILPKLKDLDDLQEGHVSAQKVWVPNRNGVFLNIAASFAESMGAKYILPGFNREEAATFPDNSEAYLNAANDAFVFSTLSGVKVKCFTLDFDKVQMAQKAVELGIDFKKVWSCYENGEAPCGNCESCQRTIRALEVMGL